MCESAPARFRREAQEHSAAHEAQRSTASGAKRVFGYFLRGQKVTRSAAGRVEVCRDAAYAKHFLCSSQLQIFVTFPVPNVHWFSLHLRHCSRLSAKLNNPVPKSVGIQ